MKTLQRGDRYLTGGRFVGISRGGVVWVSYEGGLDFERMCQAFDRMNGGAQ